LSVVAEAAASAEPILLLRGVGRRFGGLQAVREVDLAVTSGERRAILGPNGAGKTTLFNVVAGEFPPTSGSIELFGKDVTYLPARTRVRLGLTRTYQTSRLFLGLSVEDNLYLSVVGVEGGRLRPVFRPGRDGELRGKAREIGERVGLADQLPVLVRNLSHGEQRQLEVGMALAGEPRIMMLDEPAAGLSRTERVKLTEMLLALDRSITLLLIEHDMDVALTVAEYVTMMHDGRVIVEGSPAEIRANEMVHDLYLGRGHYGDE
jgi:branched-chain amino acid transport system ATP-binding protein